ncbi:hypothetical protein, partial [Herbiconiux daphne]
DSVGQIDDGSYQYLLNQVQVLNITTAPVKEDILNSGVRYDIVIAKWVSDATSVTVTDAREYVESKSTYLAPVGYASVIHSGDGKAVTLTKAGGGNWSLTVKGQAIKPVSVFDHNKVDVVVNNDGPSIKITNKSKNPLLLKHSLVCAIGKNTTATPYKWNINSIIASRGVVGDTNYAGTDMDKPPGQGVV